MFGFFYFISVMLVLVCLMAYADRKNVPCNLKTIIGAIVLSILWPLFVLGALAGYAFVFMDELKL